MSSRSTSTCFDFVSDYLEKGVRFLETIVLCAKEERESYRFRLRHVEEELDCNEFDNRSDLDLCYTITADLDECAFLNTIESASCEGVNVLDNLGRLESLRVDGYSLSDFAFPMNLKKLTLSYNRNPWSEISTIGRLSKLEVLKLLRDSFVGETWELKEGEFPNLRFLKLKGLNVRTWMASGDSFPRLQILHLHSCRDLEDIPSCLYESSALEMIEVINCRESAILSVKQIQELQMDMGNEDLKIVIHSRNYLSGEMEQESIMAYTTTVLTCLT